MSYDLAAARAQLRFLIRDPNGDAIGDTALRDSYLNPAYLAWWRAHELRPGNLLATISVTDAQGYDPVQLSATAPGPDVSLKVEHVTYREAAAVWHTVQHTEYERVLELQLTEGLTTDGPPDLVGIRYAHQDTGGSLPSGISASPWLEVNYYPIVDTAGAGLTLDLWATRQPTLLSNDTDKFATDPVSAYMITRAAAFRAGQDIELEPWRLQAIAAPIAAWAKTKDRFEAMLRGLEVEAA